MTQMDHVARTARVLNTHELSLPEHFVLCSAGYRVTHTPDAFVEHVFSAAESDRRSHASPSELTAALERVLSGGRGAVPPLNAVSFAGQLEEVGRCPAGPRRTSAAEAWTALLHVPSRSSGVTR